MGEDGSLVFDTQLDQTGFVKGSQKVLDAIKDLVSAVDTLGDNMMRSFGQIVPLLQSVAQSAASINERLAGSATQAADANAQVVSSEEQVAQAVQTATNAINQQNQATQNMTAGTQAAQSAENAATQMAGSYDKAMARIQKQIDSLKAKLADYYSAVAQIQQSTDETLALTNSDEQAAKVLEMEEVQLEKLNAKYASKLDTLKALEAEYERLAALQAQQNASPNTSDWDSKGLSAQIEKAIAAVDRYEQKMDKMNYMGATDDQWRSIGYDITQAAYKLDDYRAALDAMRANGLIDDGQYTQLATALEQARQKAVGLAQATQETRRFSDILKSAASSALRLTASLAKIPLNAARTGFKKLGQSVGEYIKKAQNAKLSSNSLVKALTSVKRMLISRVKRMFISGIFNGVKESLTQLAQYSTSFGAAMNRIKTAAAGLKTNLASTIGGLIEAVEPFITRFLNMLSKMVSYVNAAFSFLRGKSTVTTANTAASSAQSYSNNMGSAASNTKKAAEAQKELNRQVYGFDELNKRMDEEKEEDETPEDYAVNPFTDSPISDVLPENLKDWLQELKDLWNNEDYFGFGQKLAEKLNEMMQIADDWINNVFRPQGVKWAKNIAEVLNGLVDGFDAELLGKLLADGLNAVFDIVNTFLETFDFEKFGTKIGQTITSWFANVEWDLIGRTFANGVNAIIDTLHGLVNAIDWDNAGKSISTFFNTFLLGIDWNKLVKTVSDGVKGLETALIGFIDGIKWREIANSLAESLEHLDIAGILTKAGQIIGDLLKGIMEFVAEFVKQVDWSGLMQGIWDGLVGMLQSIDWGGLISTAFELLGAAVGAASSLAATLISNILNLLVTAFEDGWDYFADYIDKCGGDIVAGLLLGIVNALVNIGQWIWEHIFKPFWDGLCHAFGIASPSTKMMEIGNDIIAGLLEGIIAAWEAIITFFSTAFKSIKSTITNIWDSVKDATMRVWDDIKKGVSQKYNTLKTEVLSITENIRSSLSNAWDHIKVKTNDIWENVKATISQKFESAKEKVNTAAQKISSSLSGTWDTVKNKATTAWDSINNTISDRLSTAKDYISEKSSEIKSNLSTAWNFIATETRSVWTAIKSNLTTAITSIKTYADTAWKGIKSAATSAWSSIASTIKSSWSNTVAALKSYQSSWVSIGQNLVNGLRQGISSAWNGVTSTVRSLASNVTSSLKSIFQIRSPSRVWAEIGEYLDLGLAEGIETTQGDVLKTVSNMARGINDEMDLEEASVSINSGVNSAASELSKVAGILSQIAETFQSITDMLTNIGGLRVPALVSGSIVPSRTAVSGDGEDIFNSARFDSFESGLDERLYDQRELLERILSAITNRRGLDPDEFADAIAFSMSNVIRGYGGV